MARHCVQVLQMTLSELRCTSLESHISKYFSSVSGAATDFSFNSRTLEPLPRWKSFFLFCFVFLFTPHLPPCIIHDLAAAVGLLPVPWPIYRVARESISHGRRSANSSLWSEHMNPFMASATYDSSSRSSSSLSLADTGVAFKSTNNSNRIEYHRMELMYVVDLKLGNYAIT